MANEHGFNLPDVISIKRKTEEIKKKEKNNVVHWKTKLEFYSISQSPILNTTSYIGYMQRDHIRNYYICTHRTCI